MKLKAVFKGALQEVPQRIQKSFQLNDRYYSAKITLDCMGKYGLSVPYGITDATARRSVNYKPAVEEVTRQMVDAYSSATKSFSEIASKCSAIETDILYQRRLQNLQLETYTKRSCSEPKPSKNAVEKELKEEAEKKFYRLFSNRNSEKQQYVSENLEAVYLDRLRHWEEIVTYHDYVESVIAAKKNKEYLEKFNREKSDLENKINGPDTYVKQQLATILNDRNIPLNNLPFELDYDQRNGLIDIVVDMPVDLPIPMSFAKLYASGKLWVKSKQDRDIANEKLSFFLGLSFYLASKLFGLALNITKVRVSLVEAVSNQGISWLELEREPLRQLIISGNISLFSTATTYNHLFEPDNITGLKKIHLGQFHQKVGEIIDRSSKFPRKPSQHYQSNQIEISISDAKILAEYIHDNQTIIEAINEAVNDGVSTVMVTKGQAAVLEEIKSANISSGLSSDDVNYGPIEYEEYIISERIDENAPDYENEMKAFIQKVVDIEAPISRDLLNRRICGVMGISRVSSRLNKKLESILMDMRLRTTDDGKQFFWSDSVRPDNYRAYRTGGRREVMDIAPQEVANCIAYIIDSTGYSEKNRVLRATANELGFTRMGVNVQLSMESGLLYGVRSGILTDNGDGVYSNI